MNSGAPFLRDPDVLLVGETRDKETAVVSVDL